MLPLIIAGAKLAATFAPQIIGLFAGDKAEATATAVMDVARQITGHSDEDEAIDALRDNPEAVARFKVAVMADKHIAEQMRLADVANARDTYSRHHEATDATAKHIMTWNLPAVMLMAAANGVAVYYLRDEGTLCAVITGLVTTVINQLLTERNQVCGFRFGSSVGSKMKKG